jgi:nitrate/nitrite-specific signal transduction histidine kinase
MKERARLLGGRCWIDAQPGKGTRINVIIPFTQEKAAAKSGENKDQAN